MVKNVEGVWEATVTETGYAKSAYYANPILGLAVDTAFNVDSWTKGELGTSRDNAIYAYVGQTAYINVNEAQ